MKNFKEFMLGDKKTVEENILSSRYNLGPHKKYNNPVKWKSDVEKRGSTVKVHGAGRDTISYASGGLGTFHHGEKQGFVLEHAYSIGSSGERHDYDDTDSWKHLQNTLKGMKSVGRPRQDRAAAVKHYKTYAKPAPEVTKKANKISSLISRMLGKKQPTSTVRKPGDRRVEPGGTTNHPNDSRVRHFDRRGNLRKESINSSPDFSDSFQAKAGWKHSGTERNGTVVFTHPNKPLQHLSINKKGAWLHTGFLRKSVTGKNQQDLATHLKTVTEDHKKGLTVLKTSYHTTLKALPQTGDEHDRISHTSIVKKYLNRRKRVNIVNTSTLKSEDAGSAGPTTVTVGAAVGPTDIGVNRKKKNPILAKIFRRKY